MDQAGGALVEPDGTGSALVTLVWQADDGTHSVVLAGGVAGWDLPHEQMQHLPLTNLWYGTYRVERYSPEIEYRLLPGDSARWVEPPHSRGGQVITYAFPRKGEEPTVRQLRLAAVKLPGAPSFPWVTPEPGAPAGEVTLHWVRSRILDVGRHAWVYTPPGYSPHGDPCDLLIQLDGETYTDLVKVPAILDGLITSGQLSPTVAVLIDNIDHETRMREFGCNRPFVSFLTDDLIPWTAERYRIAPDAERITLSGSSMGGLAVLYAGLERPDVFGNILSQSGSFWWRPEDRGEHGWLIREYRDRPTVPIRIYQEIGTRELGRPSGDAPSQLHANEHMRDVLISKEYRLVYREYEHDHSWECWRQSLPNALLALRGREPGSG